MQSEKLFLFFMFSYQVSFSSLFSTTSTKVADQDWLYLLLRPGLGQCLPLLVSPEVFPSTLGPTLQRNLDLYTFLATTPLPLLRQLYLGLSGHQEVEPLFLLPVLPATISFLFLPSLDPFGSPSGLLSSSCTPEQPQDLLPLRKDLPLPGSQCMCRREHWCWSPRRRGDFHPTLVTLPLFSWLSHQDTAKIPTSGVRASSPSWKTCLGDPLRV